MKLKTIGVAVAAGSIGYFIGFYEMKYKVMKAMTEGWIKEQESNNNPRYINWYKHSKEETES